MNRSHYKAFLFMLGMLFVVMVGISSLNALERPPLAQEEFIRIEQYFNLTNELKSLRREHSQEMKRLEAALPPLDGERYRQAVGQAQEYDNKQKANLFLKYGMTEQEYEKLQGELLHSPGKLMAYIAAGGVVPQMKDKEKPERVLSPQERLQEKGITFDPLNKETLDTVLNNPNPAIRLDAIEAMRDLKDPAYAPYLVKLLKDENQFVRLASSGVLCDMSRFEGVPMVLAHLGDPDQDLVTRMSVISSAGHCLTNHDVAQRLLEVLKTERNGSLRLQMALPFERQADISWLDGLREVQKAETDFMVKHLLDKIVRDLERKKRIQELIR